MVQEKFHYQDQQHVHVVLQVQFQVLLGVLGVIDADLDNIKAVPAKHRVIIAPEKLIQMLHKIETAKAAALANAQIVSTQDAVAENAVHLGQKRDAIAKEQ